MCTSRLKKFSSSEALAIHTPSRRGFPSTLFTNKYRQGSSCVSIVCFHFSRYSLSDFGIQKVLDPCSSLSSFSIDNSGTRTRRTSIKWMKLEKKVDKEPKLSIIQAIYKAVLVALSISFEHVAFLSYQIQLHLNSFSQSGRFSLHSISGFLKNVR